MKNSALHQFKWRDSATHPFRVEVQSTQMEVDSIGETLLVSKTVTPDLERLDTTVDLLGLPIADFQYDGIQNIP